MKPETEKLLGTLEVLIGDLSHTFFWEVEERGEFNVWNLMIAEGFVQLSDVDVAIAHWQSVERWGTPTDRSDYDYAPPRNERKDEWSAEIEAKRSEIYQNLLQILQLKLQNLQSFKLSIAPERKDYFEWIHPHFCAYILVGKMEDGNWLCLSPAVPDQNLPRHSKTSTLTFPSAIASEPLQSIQNLIAELTPITLYGYYYGGYNYTYEHRIFCVSANQKQLAIKLALQAAGMLTTDNPYGEDSLFRNQTQKLNQFLGTVLRDRIFYRLSFWDIAYSYEVGQAATGDWLGVRWMDKFEYNP